MQAIGTAAHETCCCFFETLVPAYIARLRRAAMSLPKSVVRRSIGNMKWRCQKIYQAKGGHIEEGGRHK